LTVINNLKISRGLGKAGQIGRDLLKGARMSSELRTEIDFDHHRPDYREKLVEMKDELQQKCPFSWSPHYDGFWLAAGHREVFESARRVEYMSNDHDPEGVRRGYKGIGIPQRSSFQAGILEMDPPEQREYRQALNAYLSPAAMDRWKPMAADISRACIDEVISTGRIDFVDDFSNIVPAVLTMALLGLPLTEWSFYCEPTHALVSTPTTSPEYPAVIEAQMQSIAKMGESIAEIRESPRPGMIDGLNHSTVGGVPLTVADIVTTVYLLIGGGLDTTTALTANALNWLHDHPEHREALATDPHLLDTATEEFLRYFTPAQGDARTISQDCEILGQSFKEGERIWLSWAMANRDPSVFPNPDEVVLDRFPNRHTSFGLGVHRCIGSNVARTQFKAMLTEALRRLPDYRCVPEGAVRYETTGIINGWNHLPAVFTPGEPLGPGLEETISKWQDRCDQDGLAERVTKRQNR
jgi:cytochrome P450